MIITICSTSKICFQMVLLQSLTAKESPIFGLLFMPTKSTSPDIDIKIFCQNPCCITTPTLPCVLTRAFASVEGKNACRAPTARAVSFVEKLCFNSAPRAVLVRGFTMWYHEAFKVSSLSLHNSKCYVHVNKLMHYFLFSKFSQDCSQGQGNSSKGTIEAQTGVIVKCPRSYVNGKVSSNGEQRTASYAYHTREVCNWIICIGGISYQSHSSSNPSKRVFILQLHLLPE